MKSVAPWLALLLAAVFFTGCQQPTSSGSKDKSDTDSETTTTTTTSNDTTAPSDVDDLVVTAGDGQIVLDWTDPTDSDLSKVVISSDSFTTVEVAKGVGTATITGLTNRSAYAFRVKAKDTSGNLSGGLKRGGMPLSPDNTATLIISLPTDDETILPISSTNPLRIEVYSDLAQAQNGTPILRTKFTSVSQERELSIAAGMRLYYVGYYDEGDNGNRLGDLVGDIGVVDGSAEDGDEVEATYYPLASNIRAGKALVSYTDLGKILYFSYAYHGNEFSMLETTDDVAGMRAVITTNGEDPTDTSAWVYAPNGGPLSNQRAMIGLDSTKNYYYFMFLDLNYDEVFDEGEYYSNPLDVDLVDLDELSFDEETGLPLVPEGNSFGFWDPSEGLILETEAPEEEA